VTSRFAFEGFLSTSKKSRRDHLNAVKDDTHTLIFYEAPHKLLSTLTDMRDTFGAGRKISLARELTKIHEEVRRTTLGEAVEYYTENNPKGEFVLVIEGAEPPAPPEMTLEDAVDMARRLVEEGMRPTDAAKQISAQSAFRKSEIYTALISEE